MKNRILKGVVLAAMLGLCLALTGCVVPPDDLTPSTGYTPNSGYQDVAPQITNTPTPTPTQQPTTKGPEATLDWGAMWGVTPTPTVAGGMTSTATDNGYGINRVTPAPATTSGGTVTTKPATATATPVAALKLGDDGSEVRRLQTRLKELGYYKGSVDGDFGEGTESAVKAFQQQNGLTVDGKAGSYTLSKLYSSSARRAPSTVTNTPRPTATPTPRATSVPDTDVYLEIGSSGSKVRTLQNRLIELGWLTGEADGSYGAATAYAVKAFQAKHDLWEDGKAGPDTLTILYSTKASSTSTPSASVGKTLQEGQSSDAVRAMQKRLKALGYLSGSVDGSYGQATKAAVIAFQTANGLKADGRAGTSTLNLLYSDEAKSADVLTSSGSNTGAGVTVNGYTTLREGDSGDAVKTLQRALKNRGYYSGSIDGVYGSSTVAAVTAFQQRNGLRVDGTAGPSTQTALYDTDALDADEFETLRPGDSGIDIRNMQYTLYELGYYDGKVDGVYGDTTKDAVRAFQIRNSISPVDGIAGTKTLTVLYSSKAIAAQAAVTEYTTLRKGDRGNSVVEMQDSLQQLGYLYEVTGFYDDATMEAVKNFQRRNGLSVDGTAGQETLQVLYSSSPVPAY